MTISSLLGEYQKRVDLCIQQATGDLGAIEIEAGRRLSVAIGNTQSAFVDVLSENQGRVDRFIQSRLNELGSYIEGLEKRTNSIADMGKLTKIYARGLSNGKNHLPKLQKISPRHIDLACPGREANISFTGNFNYASDRRYRPFLELCEMTYKPARADLYCLDFTIGIDNLKAPYTPALLSIPYEAGWLGCCRPHIKISTFKVWIGAQYEPDNYSSDEDERFGSLFEEDTVPRRCDAAEI